MHPDTPWNMVRFAEVHRQVGAICHVTAHLESELEEAVIEISGNSEHVRVLVLGQRHPVLVSMIRALIREGHVPEGRWRTELESALSRVRKLMEKRDDAVHSGWMLPNDTPADHIGSVRAARSKGLTFPNWHTDDLEKLRADLVQLTDDISTLSHNAMTPKTGQTPFPWRGDPA